MQSMRRRSAALVVVAAVHLLAAVAAVAAADPPTPPASPAQASLAAPDSSSSSGAFSPLQAPAPAPLLLVSTPAPAPAPAQQPAAAVPRLVLEPLDGPPPWASQPPQDYDECGGQRRQQRAAAEAVAEADAEGVTLDLVLYGDSITRLFVRDDTFEARFGDWRALALGMCGSSVAQLAWRILEGGERPAAAPRAAALLIGANNLLPLKGLEAPAGQLEWLVRWMRAAWPDTRVGAGEGGGRGVTWEVGRGHALGVASLDPSQWH